MKKLLIVFFVMGMLHFCNAQITGSGDAKFTPPVIKKDMTTSKLIEKVNFIPPVIKKDVEVKNEEIKFTPPVIKKNTISKNKEKLKFTRPVIIKDETVNN